MTPTGRAVPAAGSRAHPARDPVAWGLLVVSAAAVAVALSVLFGVGNSGGDIDVYRSGGAAVLHGQPLYDSASAAGLGFTYPPFVAILFVPLALLPLGVVVAGWAVVGFAGLVASLWIVLGAVGVLDQPRRIRLTAVGALVALPLVPVSTHLWAGQINLPLMALVLADLVAGRSRWRGVGIGVAAGIKLTPLIFVPYLLCTGRVRAAVTATGAFLGTALVGALVLPADSRRYWFDALLDLDRVVPVEQAWIFGGSIRGTLERTTDWPVVGWLVLAGLVGVAGLAVAALASRRGHELVGILCCAVTGLLVSPVSWPWHWVWCVPLAVLAVVAARRHRGASAGLAALWLAMAAATWWALAVLFGVAIPAAVTVVFANLLVVLGLATLAAVSWWLTRPAARAG